MQLERQKRRNENLKLKEEKVKTNESGADRLIRIILGILLFIIGWVILKNRLLGIIFDIIGVILFITGITGFCGLYKVFGCSTKKEETPQKPT